MPIDEITNYVHISDRIASSGQPKKFQFHEIAQADYEVVINLAMPTSDNAIPEEGNIVAAQKMQYIHIPVPFEAPTVEHLNDFIAVMNAFKQKNVWVHCVVNFRASAFIFLYLRLANNTSMEEAKKVILKSWKPDDVWKTFMQITKDEIYTLNQ